MDARGSRGGEQPGQRSGGDTQSPAFLQKLRQRFVGRGLDLAGTEKVQQTFASARAFGQDQHATVCRCQVVLEFLQGLFGAALD